MRFNTIAKRFNILENESNIFALQFSELAIIFKTKAILYLPNFIQQIIFVRRNSVDENKSINNKCVVVY